MHRHEPRNKETAANEKGGRREKPSMPVEATGKRASDAAHFPECLFSGQ